MKRSLVTALTGVVAGALVACSGPAGSEQNRSDQELTSPIALEMQELIEEHSAAPEFSAPGPEVDTSQVAGTTIAVVAIDLRVPALAEVTESVQEAAELLDIDVTVFDAQSQATQMQQGMQQAIDSGADAIISAGLVIEVVASQIADARDRGIPTVDVINTPPERDVPGQGSDPNVFANVSPDSDLAGRLIAATAVVHTDGEAKVALLDTSELTASPAIFGAMEDVFDACEGCEIVAETDTALNDWSTELPGLAATQVRRNPEINFLLPMYDAMGIFATTGVQQAGATGEVRIASQDGTPAALELVKSGDIFVANVAKSTPWAGWAAVDQAVRGMLEMEPADPVLPIRYVDREALQDVDTSNAATVDADLFGTGYRDGYSELWGLS